ncbi:glycoside hydrolase family 31 protein [Sphingomonas aerophila]|uniref:Alpha-glucosidase (Family GH31 glycosyl hydrolase) n=1 Tax=Sphingomonas aerophila TaxID=1344948 RepID=A0A7W9BBE4_9SPHN|nr:glycoside hydrolase family 31 protein [Sphingomonas aerophila]MBB5714107.1 alpha-glucosidase (family GH31 glycosyl hydrolase) [Sphingomonas aerophila]
MKRIRSYLAGTAILLSAAASPALAAPPSVVPAMHGKAAAGAIIQRGQVRFTVLTPEMIRMEWSPDSRFVDQPSQVFINREQPVPRYSVSTRGALLVIETEKLRLSYRLNSGRFTKANLQVGSRAGAPAFMWRPGDVETGNLRGTARTVDRYSGDVQIDSGKRLDLGQGLLSRDGWHVVDDSRSFLLDDSPWPWAKLRACRDCQDLYFFGYGHRYEQALGDYAKVAGREPMPPRFAFGYWWSRYWNYSDDEMRGLVADFERYRIPLDVMVIDMDWHRTDGLSWDSKYVKRDVFGESVGWTGYTWNRSLFPEPDRFLNFLHAHKLKTTVNLHPASGIPANEESYPAISKAMKVADGNPVPFEAADKGFVEQYFKLTLDPLRAQGIDFWWLDWQQWPESKLVPGLSNTWWLNYVFFTQMQRTSADRGLIYHRWGGLGNHRYQIGFSGDSVISWPSLAYQPYFTATASNVLYGYWSHDIGGHFFAESTPESDRHIDPELYVRWMQFGAYSPILRTHSSKEAGLRKEPWRFAPEVFAALRHSIEQRYAMAPYIYTAARQAYDGGVSIMRPLYYQWPEQPEAYSTRGEYMFGDDMLVAPVTEPMKVGVASASIWLPPGRWYDENRGELVEGGRRISRDYTLDEVPVFTRAGAVVPLNPPSVQKLQDMDNGSVVLRVSPGGKSVSRVYADAGNSEGYRNGEYSLTRVESERDLRRATLVVHPREGRYPGMLDTTQVTVELPSAAIPERVVVNGRAYSRSDDGQEGSWSYDGTELTARIKVPAQSASEPLNVSVAFGETPPGFNALLYRMKRTAAAVAWLKERWEPPTPLPDDLALAAQLGRLIDYHPERMAALVRQFDARIGALVAQVNASHAKAEVKKGFAAMMQSVQR